MQLATLGVSNELYAPLKTQGAKLFGAELSKEMAAIEERRKMEEGKA
jgi:hypothetical protein